ncbi:hypothetical protein V1517DRAFT_321009 [Lipomyces orientalis]|uniref:Uncharacterized protein n=1 Tax=Lipomyces orientalis TaxID=1233043 RepID=A0ACC3TSU1_9ASCO
MSMPLFSTQLQSSDNSSLGNSSNPVAVDLDDDVIMPAPPSDEPDHSTEQQLQDGLRRLDELYSELLSLRIAAPKLIRTLTQFESTAAPPDVYAAFASCAREILGEIEQFSVAYKNAADIISYANKSRAANSDGLVRGTFTPLSDSEMVKNNDGDEIMIL